VESCDPSSPTLCVGRGGLLVAWETKYIIRWYGMDGCVIVLL
jgi:hypothetical protein